MPIQKRAQELFRELRDFPMTRELAVLSAEVNVNAGVVKVFRNQQGEIGLMVPVTKADLADFRPDTRSRSLRLTTQATKELQHIRLALNNLRFEKVFSIFVDEVLDALETSSNSPVVIVSGMLKRWRDLFREFRPTTSWSFEKELGLLCELEVLHSLYSEQSSDLMERWTGPDGQPHDFELATESLECKATSSTNAFQISVNGVAQLMPTPGKDLRLVVRNYLLDPDGPISVPQMVDKLLALDSIETEKFIEKLKKLGCPVFEDDGESFFHQFHPVDSHEFHVVDGFPRIANIGLEERIQSVSYSLNLSDPEQVPGHLTENLILGIGEQ